MQSVKRAKPTIRVAVVEKLVTGGSYMGDKKVMSCFFIWVLPTWMYKVCENSLSCSPMICALSLSMFYFKKGV